MKFLKRDKRLYIIFLILFPSLLILISSATNVRGGPDIPVPHADNGWHWDVDVGDHIYYEGEFIVTNATTGEVSMMFKEIWIYNITSIENVTTNWLGTHQFSQVNATQYYYNVTEDELEDYGPSSEIALFGYNSTDPITHRIRAGQNGMPFILPINGSSGLEVDVLAPIINETLYYPMGQVAYNPFDYFESNITLNRIYFENSTHDYFIEGYYYDNGTMDHGKANFMVNMGDGPLLFNVTMKQVFDYSITDEVEWGVNIGDTFCYDSIENEYTIDSSNDIKVEITGFSDILLNKSKNGFSNDVIPMAYQVVYADRYLWNGTDYEYLDNNIIGAANNFYPQYYDEVDNNPIMPFIWPINVPREDYEFMWNIDTLGIWDQMPFDEISLTENGMLEFELRNTTGIDFVEIRVNKTTGVAQSFLMVSSYSMMFYELKYQSIIDWSVDIGDVIYYKSNSEDLYDIKATIVAIDTVYTNMTWLVNEFNYEGIPLALPTHQPEYQFFSYIIAELEVWDSSTGSWMHMTETIIAIANIYWPVSPIIFMEGGPPLIMPRGTTSSELTDFFTMWSPVYDDITSNPGHIILRNTTVNRELNFQFDETSGEVTMMHGWSKMPFPGSEWSYMSVYPKFYHPLHVGTNTFAVSTNFPSGATVTIEMTLTGSGAAYVSTFFPMNPVDEPLPVGTAFAFFDQLMVNHTLIYGNITMTITLPPSIDLSTVGFFFFAYNMSGTEEWDSPPPEFYIDSVTYNFAANSIEIEMQSFPFGLISAMAFIDSEDLPPEIPGYDLFLMSLLIIMVSGILVKKIRKKH